MDELDVNSAMYDMKLCDLPLFIDAHENWTKYNFCSGYRLHGQDIYGSACSPIYM